MRRCYTCKEIKDIRLFKKRYDKPLNRDYQCNECHAKEKSIRRKKNPEKALFIHAKSRAKELNKEFSILVEDIKIPTICPALGIPIIVNGNKMTDNSPTVDRIDNSKGYVKGNVIVVCNKTNRIKNSATPDEIIKIGNFYKLLIT